MPDDSAAPVPAEQDQDLAAAEHMADGSVVIVDVEAGWGCVAHDGPLRRAATGLMTTRWCERPLTAA